jgi:hypothetical protein
MTFIMPSLPTITILDASPAARSVAPAIVFRVRIDVAGTVHAIVLRSQIQIDARGRRYTAGERERLYELFGDVSQFERAVRPLTWCQPVLAVPAFDDRIECDLAVPCTYDLEVASAKYLHAVRDGAVPLRFLFAGTIFRVTDGTLLLEPVPWDVEASFPLAGGVWAAAMDQHFPGGGWLRLQRETIDRLQAFRGRSAVLSWDEAIDALLDAAPGSTGRHAERPESRRAG